MSTLYMNFLRLMCLYSSIFEVLLSSQQSGTFRVPSAYIGRRLVEPLVVSRHTEVSTQLRCVSFCMMLLQDCSLMSYNSDQKVCEISRNKWLASYMPNETGWCIIMKPGIWELAFKGSRDIGKSVYNLWIGNNYTTQYTDNMFKMVTSSEHYKSEMVEKWAALEIKRAALVMYRDSNEVLRLEFDGTNSNKINWFDRSRLRRSPFQDILTAYLGHFSIEGDSPHTRRFSVQRMYNGCSTDEGWVVVKELPGGVCSYELSISTFPKFWYSNGTTSVNWNTVLDGSHSLEADVMAIYIRT